MRDKRTPLKPSQEKKVSVARGGKPGAHSKAPQIQHLSSSQWQKMRDHFDLVRREVKRKSDGKKRTLSDDDEKDPVAEALSTAASLFTNPNVTYTFRLVNTGTIQCTNTVQLLTYLSWDPSSNAEYSNYLSFLFDEVRIRRVRLTLVPISGGQQGSSPIFAVSSDLGFTATNPTAFNQVTDNPNSRLCDSWYVRSKEYVWDVTVPGDYLFAGVSSPAATQYAGCMGEFMIAQMTTATLTEFVFAYMIEFVLEFRSRT